MGFIILAKTGISGCLLKTHYIIDAPMSGQKF